MASLENVLHKNYILDNYLLIEHIGKGSFANVWKAQHLQTKCCVALKSIKKDVINDKSNDRLEREINLMKSFNHPYIIEFFEIFEDQNQKYIVMEYAEKGNMKDYVNKNGKLPENCAKHYFFEIISAIKYLHTEHKVAHRDIKCENILIDKCNNVKIVDFGLSAVFSSDNQLMSTTCGSPAYASPEMICKSNYTFKADIWSAGIFLYAICAGHLPFDDSNTNKLLQKILYAEITYPAHFSSELIDLLEKMLQRSPSNRWSTEDILNHVWMKNIEFESIHVCFNEMIDEKESNLCEETINEMKQKGILYQSITPSSILVSSSLFAMYKMVKKQKQKDYIENKMFITLKPIPSCILKQNSKQLVKPHIHAHTNNQGKSPCIKTKPEIRINSMIKPKKTRRLSKPIDLPVLFFSNETENLNDTL